MNKRQYIEYMIATPNNYTCTNLGNHLQGEQAVSHDAINDYMRRDKLTPRDLWEVVAPLLHDSPEAYLIVDDSVQDKRYSRAIEMVKLQYSGDEGSLVRGIGVVNLLHTSGQTDDFYPIDYHVYSPEDDGKTKRQHFQEMVVRAKSDKRLQAHGALRQLVRFCRATIWRVVISLGTHFEGEPSKSPPQSMPPRPISCVIF